MTDDLVAIKKLYAENAAAFSAGDLSALARLYEEDVMQFPPNASAVTGWGAIQSALEGELQSISVAATIAVAEVHVAESWAFARGTYRTVATPIGDGPPTEASGNWLDILRRQPDGSWKIFRSTWSNKE